MASFLRQIKFQQAFLLSPTIIALENSRSTKYPLISHVDHLRVVMFMERVLILVGNDFEDSELIYPYYRLQEAGYQVVLVGPQGETEYRGKHGVQFRSDLSPEEVNADDYVAVIIPGGRAPDRMRVNSGLVEVVGDAFRMGKVVAAVCHGPQMMIEADILKGRRATCYKSVATDLKNAGARYEDASVVVDGNLVTSRGPADLPDFCREIIKLLRK